MIRSLQTKPYMLGSDEGQSLQSLGVSVTIKATSEQTGGLFNLFEVCCPPGYNLPLHIHYAEDAAVYVLQGTLVFFWGSEKNEGRAGSYFFLPRGTPHGFRVEDDGPVRILYATIPAGFDRFLIDQELLTRSSECEMAASRHKIEILGPLPE